MPMCKHNQEYETCVFGCTFRKKEELKLENDKLQAELERVKNGREELRAGWLHTQKEFQQLQAELDRLKEGINYAIDGIDALLPQDTEARKDMLAIKQTLAQALKDRRPE